MIVVKVELWPYGEESAAVELERMTIANDGTGTREIGNYNVQANRRGKNVRKGRVCGEPRFKHSIWRLVARAVSVIAPGDIP